MELYDEQKTELYDLSKDIGENADIAELHPERVAAMRTSLDTWRRDNDVQYNTPNPNCIEDQFRFLYVSVDPSRFDPLQADESDWARIQEWRKGMDTVTKK